HYDRGEYPAAIAEWDKLNGIIDRYPAFRMVIDYMRGRAKTLPQDQASQVDQKLAERRSAVSEIFRKAKEAYARGDYEGSIAEWQKLTAYLPEDAPEIRLLSDFKKYY